MFGVSLVSRPGIEVRVGPLCVRKGCGGLGEKVPRAG